MITGEYRDIWFTHVRRRKEARKEARRLLCILGIQFALMACTAANPPAKSPNRPTLRIMAWQTPATLNPRATLDASGQWLAAFMFRGLVQLDPDLKPSADLASSWTSNSRGDTWIFRTPPARDHAGNKITSNLLARCLENYHSEKLKSPLAALLPHWKSARAINEQELVIELSRPDPYLVQTLSSFRYFIPEGSSEPCTEPAPGQKVVANGDYRAEPWDTRPKQDFRLTSLRPSYPDLHFTFVQDDNTRTLRILRDEVDATLNGISIAKTRWLEATQGEDFKLIHRPSARVSYFAFNLRDPLLNNRQVRQAIALSIDREKIVRSTMGTLGTPAGSLLSPLLAENKQAHFEFAPRKAERLLDEAGLPRKNDGYRFKLSYKTTPIREGLETALIISEMLRKVGIEVKLEIVEPAVFFASIRKNAFQLYSSRWQGITDASILYRTLRSGHPSNRSGYADTEMDKLLDAAMSEFNAEKRKALLGEVQDKAAQDLPFFPLWFWHNTLIVRNGIQSVDEKSISLNGSFDVFSKLQETPL